MEIAPRLPNIKLNNGLFVTKIFPKKYATPCKRRIENVFFAKKRAAPLYRKSTGYPFRRDVFARSTSLSLSAEVENVMFARLFFEKTARFSTTGLKNVHAKYVFQKERVSSWPPS